jgi:hypothetical protein
VWFGTLVSELILCCAVAVRANLCGDTFYER